MLTFFLWLLAQQQDLDQDIQKAMEKDRAAKSSAQPQPQPQPPAQPAAPAPTEPAPAPPAPLFGAQQAVRQPGASLLNPAISVIVDADFGGYAGHDPARVAGLPASGDDPGQEGFGMQEVELAFQSAIDPYLEGAVFLTIPNLDGIEVEEAYLVTTSLPFSLQVKAGSFRSQLGRNNTQHLHLQHFTRRPLMTPLLLGADGLRAPGAQVSVLLPLPWYATFYAEAFSIGPPDDRSRTQSFGGGDRGDLASLTLVAVLEQYFDLGETVSLLGGLNFATGQAYECPADPCPPERRAALYGADVYLKWKPPNVVQTYASFQWTTEYFARTLAEGGPTEGALYTEPVLQLARRFWAGARLDVTGLPDGPNIPRRYGLGGSLTFTPSEFSRLRGFVQEIWGNGVPASTVLFLQAEFAMGAHGAHPF